MNLARIMEKYRLTLTNFFATVEITDGNFRTLAACPKSDGWTVGELRDHLAGELENIGYK